jgi:hypothetical protein
MESLLKAWKSGRKLLLPFFDHYSAEQLNFIPVGFNNNLIWNLGHIIVAQQSLVYKGSNLPMHITEDIVELYKPGTKPTRTITAAEIAELKTLLISVIDQTESDLQKGIFTHYNERHTITGFHLASLQDALEFNNFHEGLHLGCMMSIRKFL